MRGRGKGEKIERRARIVIDCVSSPETAAGVQGTERKAERKKDKGIMPTNIWEIRLKIYNANLPRVSYKTFCVRYITLVTVTVRDFFRKLVIIRHK